ncbi:DUF6456 domain-containing protein [Defluviimonas sp. WL0050]|uniref:DUF6456 domain-containing protein n=1 Tax=Albidovulum litorale TaxID=2984134 RepID=A0ABT2ZP24_9RHOB|nr:DUF6456 domain-containing protein [Defluviimonas sp. WL0050]MCV2872901.1 DUF6456 domain-containing protein [Defluviimonas sp. WL0050]
MTVMAQPPAALPGWLPENARLYLRHVEEGLSLRALARFEGCHASTVLRKVRAFENRRDDPLIDEALNRFGRLYVPPSWSERARKTETACQKQEGACHMSAPVRSTQCHVPDEAALHREARRILRRLCEIGAVLAVSTEMEKAVVLKGTVRTGVVDRTVAQAFALNDWIAVQKTGRVTTYEITGAGRAMLKRLLAQDQATRNPGFAEAQSPFAEQHRDWEERNVADPGAENQRRVRYNLAESPLTVLARRKEKDGNPFLSPELVAAGERLREDFELAQMGPRVAQNWDRFLTAGDRGAFSGGVGGGSGQARDRVAAALRDLGPGLGDMVLRCCCFLEGLEAAEKRMGWSARSGKIVLRIALQRLKRHYDETYGGQSPMIG